MGAGISGPKSAVQSSIDAAKNSNILDFFGIECSNLRLSFDSYTWSEELKRNCQTIRFNYCHSFPNVKVIYAATGRVARVESVRCIRFEDCTGLTTPFIEYLLTSCPNLQDLSIINCSGISYLPPIMNKFSSLRKLTLVNIPTLQNLTNIPVNLSCLSIIDCPVEILSQTLPMNVRIINTNIASIKGLRNLSKVEIVSNKKLKLVEFPQNLTSLTVYDNLTELSCENCDKICLKNPNYKFIEEAKDVLNRVEKTEPMDAYSVLSFWTPTVSRSNALYCRVILPFFYGSYNVTESQYNYTSDTIDPSMFPILSSLCTNLKTKPSIEHTYKHIHASFGFSYPVRYCARNYIDKSKPHFLLWSLRVALVPNITNEIMDSALSSFGVRTELDTMVFRTFCYLIHGALYCHPIQDFDDLLANAVKLSIQGIESSESFLKLLNVKASVKKAYDTTPSLILLYIINSLKQRESISDELANPAVTRPLYMLLNAALNGLSNESFEAMRSIKPLTHVYNTLQICSFVM